MDSAGIAIESGLAKTDFAPHIVQKEQIIPHTARHRIRIKSLAPSTLAPSRVVSRLP
jgi:hypothetical protein